MTFLIMGLYHNQAAWYNVETYDWQILNLTLHVSKGYYQSLPKEFHIKKDSKWQWGIKGEDDLIKSLIIQIDDYLSEFEQFTKQNRRENYFVIYA